MKQIETIFKNGIENSAVMNIATGEVEGKSGNFVIDEKLLPKIQFLKEGEFVEKKGASALKLVGDVRPISEITKVEVETNLDGDVLKYVNKIVKSVEPEALVYTSEVKQENITKRILGIYLPEQKIYYKNYFKRDELIDKLFKMNCKGLAMRYIKYLKILNNYPTYVKVNRISYSMIKDVHEMENISNQTILLAENNINTKEDLINLYTKLKKDLSKNDNQDARVKIQLINEIIKRTELTDEDSERENKRDVVIR